MLAPWSLLSGTYCNNGHLCGESTGKNGFPHKWPVMQSFDCVFVVSLDNLFDQTVIWLVKWKALKVMSHHPNATSLSVSTICHPISKRVFSTFLPSLWNAMFCSAIRVVSWIWITHCTPQNIVGCNNSFMLWFACFFFLFFFWGGVVAHNCSHIVYRECISMWIGYTCTSCIPGALFFY